MCTIIFLFFSTYFIIVSSNEVSKLIRNDVNHKFNFNAMSQKEERESKRKKVIKLN